MIRIIIGLVTMLLISGEVMSMPGAWKMTSLPLPKQHVVEIQAFSFQPQRTVVSPGDTIVWINRDIVPHTVTANGGTWKAQNLEEGQSLQVVVEDSGDFSYFCEFHPHMTGVLRIR